MFRTIILAFVATGCQVVLGIDDTPPSVGIEVAAEGIADATDLRLQARSIDETITIAADGTARFASRPVDGDTYTVTLVGSPRCVLGDAASGIASDGVVVELACNGLTHLDALDVAALTGTQPALADGTFAYAMTVSELQQLVRVTARSRDAAATITLGGAPLTSGVASSPLPLLMGANPITITIDHPRGAVLRSTYTLTIARSAMPAETFYAKAFPATLDMFGQSIDIDGDVMAIGAVREDSATDPSNPLDGVINDSGTGFVYRRTGRTWQLDGWLKAPNANADDLFGYSIAVAGDHVVVGAPYEDSNSSNPMNNSAADAGAAYVFRRVGTSWVFEAYLKASIPEAGAMFGTSVAIDGDTIAVGSPLQDDAGTNSGQVFVYRRSGTTWILEDTLHNAAGTSDGDQLGYRVALHGNTVAATAISGEITQSSSGIVRFYERTNTAWSFQQEIEASDPVLTGFFGESIAMTEDLFVAGAPSPTSATAPGAAYVFRKTNGTWVQERKLEADNKEADDEFGSSVAVYGDTIAVGAFREDGPGVGVDPIDRTNASSEAGVVYVFRDAGGGAWPQRRYIKAGAPDEGDWFGKAIALSSDSLVIANPGEDSAVVGDPLDDSLTSAGAANVFH